MSTSDPGFQTFAQAANVVNSLFLLENPIGAHEAGELWLFGRQLVHTIKKETKSIRRELLPFPKPQDYGQVFYLSRDAFVALVVAILCGPDDFPIDSTTINTIRLLGIPVVMDNHLPGCSWSIAKSDSLHGIDYWLQKE